MHGKLLNYLWSQLDKLQRQTAVKHHRCLCGAVPLCEMLLQQPARWLAYEKLNHDQRKSMRAECYRIENQRRAFTCRKGRGETWASHVSRRLRAHGRLEIEVQDSAIQSVKDIAQKWNLKRIPVAVFAARRNELSRASRAWMRVSPINATWFIGIWPEMEQISSREHLAGRKLRSFTASANSTQH